MVRTFIHDHSDRSSGDRFALRCLHRAAHGAGRRSGTVMVAALICLLLVSLLLGALLKRTVLGRRQLAEQQRRIQALWLVEAGLQRAAHRLSADADYPGETWQIDAGELDGIHPAAVVIEVRTAADDPAARLVAVEARFPSNTARFTKRSRRIPMVVPPNR